ncbi:MAG: hypothetical protein U9R79_08580 [Armatimonadota bacterium]|nr:hypothetical protein [Armatimonadota bacterium]
MVRPVIATLAVVAACASAEIERFPDPLPEGNVIEYWRLTHDPAIRDHANYHNTNCWSPDGRYVCYTHYDVPNVGGPDHWPIHVLDLHTGEDIAIDRGASPRWAKRHNWLFYSKPDPEGGDPWERGVEVWRYDCETGERTLITWGWEFLGSTDRRDQWLFGNQRRRDLPGKVFHTARARIAPSSPMQVIYDEHSAIRPLCNPEHDVVSTRSKRQGPFEASRLWMDLDGSNVRIGVPMIQSGHMAWSGDGTWQLVGNSQARGRRWDEPFPSDMHLLANQGFGDISPCGRSGRWICGDYAAADLRSGDGTSLPRAPSVICYPVSIGDNSGPYDADPKGSPDGTKICFVSNYPFHRAPVAWVQETTTEGPSLPVDSTEGFPEAGELNALGVVVGYSSKTPTSFEGIEIGKYDTNRYGFVKRNWAVTDFRARLMTEEELQRAHEPWSWLVEAVEQSGLEDDCPLLRQRMTDVYASVIRLPDPPHLRVANGQVQLIPGENHWETFGYRLQRNGEHVTDQPLRPGAEIVLDEAGTYQATAVEWSGLEGRASLPLEIGEGARLMILRDTPDDFSWTRDVWRIDGRLCAEEKALEADEALKEIVHLHDGVIRRERYRGGELVYAEDLNAAGAATRRCTFEGGRMRTREYWTADGKRVSREIFADDGSKVEQIRWRHHRRPDEEIDHWWYDHGWPVKRTSRDHMWEKQGDEWVQVD